MYGGGGADPHPFRAFEVAMTGFGNDYENDVLNLVLRGTAFPHAIADQVSLHIGDPGDTGANEVTDSGGSAYARQTGVWGAAVGGVSALTTDVDFNNMPAVTVTHFGTWTAAGVFAGGGACTNRTILLGDSYRLNTGTQFTLE